MRKFLTSAVVISMFALATPVKAGPTANELSYRIDLLEKSLKSVNKKLSNNYVGPKNQQVMSDAKNEQVFVKLQESEEQIRTLTSDVERLTMEREELYEKQKQMQDDFNMRFSEMEKRLASAETKVNALIEEKLAIKRAEEEAAKKKAEKVAAEAKAKKDKDTRIKNDYGKMKPGELYNLALTSLKTPKNKNYGPAEKQFEAFLYLYPNNKLASNAKYWLGETYFSMGKFEEAATQFGEGFEKYRNSAKAPDMLVRLGDTLVKMNKKKEACVAFNEFANLYANAVNAKFNEKRKNAGCK
ncbi:MAG: tol-pal system protein YbgF [Alphaproteobacteria bacterium]|nr:tol-pal system protein YbgF [Alphaproteobacteria bacterium]